MGARVAVVIPWRRSRPHREAALAWVRARYVGLGLDVVVGTAPDGPWCKAAAVADGIERTDVEVLVIADADVWAPGLDVALEDVMQFGAAWAVPHRRVHRLSERATADVLAGAPIEGRPGESRWRRLDQAPYTGVVGGGVVVLTRELYTRVPLDPRFVGWGGEDHAWGYALTAIAGEPARLDAPLWHLWHPPQPRHSRRVGTPESEELRLRYARARHDRQQMAAIIREVTCPSPQESPSSASA